MIDLARSVTSSRSSVQAPVDRYFQPPSAETTTIDAGTPGLQRRGALDRSRYGRARRYACEHPHIRQPPRPLDGFPGADHGLAIQELGAAQLLEDGRDVPVVEVAQAVDHLARRGLDGPDLHGISLLLPQEPAHPQQRSRGAQAGHEVGHRRDSRAGSRARSPRSAPGGWLDCRTGTGTSTRGADRPDPAP